MMEKFTKPELLNFLCEEPASGESDIVSTSHDIENGLGLGI